MAAIAGQVIYSHVSVERERVRLAISTDPSSVSRANVLDTKTSCHAGKLAFCADSGVCVALDGGLHERDAVRSTLKLYEEPSDLALIAAGWRRWGKEMPTHLLGEFAFALFDSSTRLTVLVRDHIGTRPLFWHWDGTRLSYATFLPTLLSLLPSMPNLDEESIAAYLRRPEFLDGRTFFSGIHSVQPGSIVLVDETGPSVSDWWRPEEARSIRYRHTKDYPEAFNELVEKAIRDRAPPGSSVGAHLSGGLDSTLVALAAQGALGERGSGLTGAYSWSPSVSDVDPIVERDERTRIDDICSTAGLRLRLNDKVGANPRAFLLRPIELEGLADVYDEFPILEQAKHDGASILLSGWGGDEVASAHADGVPAALLRQARFRELLAFVRHINRGFRPLTASGRIVWRNAVLPLLPRALYDRVPYYKDPFRDGCYMSPRLKSLPLDNRAYRRHRVSGDPSADMATHLRMGHVGERMSTWAIWSAPYQVEYQYPLTDRRLQEFVLGVPPEILWGDGRPRFLARAALSRYTSTAPSKSDPANERQRLRSARDCWRTLASEAASGKFDGTCEWLDMETLRADITRGPSSDDKADVHTLLRMMPAVRIWHMAQRFGATSADGLRPY